MTLQSIEGNVKARHAISHNAVQITGPLGTLQAQGMDIQDNGMMIIFQGPIAMTLCNIGKGQPG